MDALIRFSKEGDTRFKGYKEIQEYFQKEIQNQKNYFYYKWNIKHITKDDIFYFYFEGQIIVVAQFTGEYQKREESYKHGYRVKNILIMENPISINNDIFKGRSLTYIRTDEQREELNKIPYIIDNIEEIRIKSLSVKNFVLFNKNEFEFSKGINVFIGENSTGKSQILKLLYSIININNENRRFETSIVDELENIFRPTDKKMSKLISFGEDKSFIDIDLLAYKIGFNFTKTTKYEVNIDEIPQKFYQKETLFIPAKEILSHFKGFIGTYNRREIAFDKTIYDLAISLDTPLLKDQKLIKEKNRELEEILGGEIIQLNGEFYLRRFKDKELVVSSMMAEGLRKIGTISYLLKNGALHRDTILFWDEPESNLNPKLIKDIAKLLIYLESLNIQIFIATHSLFLVREIEILREKGNKIKYFGFGFDEDNKLRVSYGDKPTDIKDIVFLDESLSQSTRYLNKKNG